MKKFAAALALALCLLAGPALGQTDPIYSAPVVVFAAQATTATSSPYAVNVTAAGETVWLQITGAGITGDYTIEGTIESEAAVLAGTAVWSTILTSTTLPASPWVSDPMPYIRVKITRTAGTFKVLMRGSGGTTFRKVM